VEVYFRELEIGKVIAIVQLDDLPIRTGDKVFLTVFNVPSSVLVVGTRAWARPSHPPARPIAWFVQKSHWGQAPAYRASVLPAARGARR